MILSDGIAKEMPAATFRVLIPITSPSYRMTEQIEGQHCWMLLFYKPLKNWHRINNEDVTKLTSGPPELPYCEGRSGRWLEKTVYTRALLALASH